MSRLVFACENGIWIPMLLNQDNSLGYIYQFQYTQTYSLGEVDYFEEHYFDRTTNHNCIRVLAVNRFCPPTLRQNGAVHFFELAEVVAYQDHFKPSVGIYNVGTNIADFPWLLNNWVQFTTPQYQYPQPNMVMLPVEQWQAANQMLSHIQQQQHRTAHDAYVAAVESQRTRSLLLQAKQEIDYLRERLEQQTLQVTPAVVATVPDLDIATAPYTPTVTLVNDKAKPILEPEVKPVLIDVQMPVVNEKVLVETLPAVKPEVAEEGMPLPPVVLETKAQEKQPKAPVKSKAQIKAEQHAEIQSIAEELITYADKINNHYNTILPLLNTLKTLVVAKDELAVLVAALDNLPIQGCADLLAKKSNPNRVKEALLIRLIGYAEQDLGTLKPQNFTNTAQTVSKDVALIAKIKELQSLVGKEKIKPVAAPVVNLDPKQLFEQALADLDAKSYLELIAKHPTLAETTQKKFLPLLPNFGPEHYSRLKEVLETIKLPAETALKCVNNQQLPATARLAVMNQLQHLDAKQYYIKNHSLDFSKLCLGFCSATCISDPELQAKLSELNAKANEWANNKAVEIFAQFATDGKAKSIDVNLLPFLAKHVNAQGQTMLMLAIRQGYAIDKLQAILQATGRHILGADTNNQNVFHYLAKHIKMENIAIVGDIRCAFEQAVKKTGCDILAEVNRKEKTSGNTYAHLLLQQKREDVALEILSQLFAVTTEDPNYHNPFHATALLQNHEQESVAVALDKKPQEWKETRELLYANLPAVIRHMMSSTTEIADLYFPTNRSFFNVSVEEPILRQWIDRKEIVRLFNALDSRTRLHKQITHICVDLMQQPQQGTNEVQIMLYFEMPLIESFKHKGKTVFGHITDYILAHNSEFEKTYLNSVLVMANVRYIAMSDGIRWKRASMLARKEKRTTADEAYIDALLIYATGQQKFVDQFMVAVVEENNYPLLIHALSSANERVRSIFTASFCNYLLVTNDFTPINVLLTKVSSELFEEVLIHVFAAAVAKNSIPLIKHVVESCKIHPNANQVALVLGLYAGVGAEALAYLFDQFEASSGAESKDHIKASFKLFSCAMLTVCTALKIEFLLNRGYDPTVLNENGANIINFFLQTAMERASTNSKICSAHIFDTLRVLLEKDERIKSLIAYVHPKSHKSTLYYVGLLSVILSDAPQIIVQLFNLLISHGAKVQTVSIRSDYTALHFAMDMNNMELLELFADELTEAEMYTMLTTEYAGETLIDRANSRVKAKILAHEFYEELKNLRDESAPKTGLRALFNFS